MCVCAFFGGGKAAWEQSSVQLFEFGDEQSLGSVQWCSSRHNMLCDTNFDIGCRYLRK